MIEISIQDTTAAATTPITVLDWNFTLTSFEMFLLGAATAAGVLIGLAMVSGGMRRSVAKRRRMREERLAERDRVSRLESEKRDLEQQLVDRNHNGVDDRDETRPVDRVEDRDRVEDGDRLVAGGRHSRRDDAF
ncbi:hypothetical protein GT755_26540 [Herbidospora sp. NEAU-GS84]|uniref:LapA family protein n=1 Tax=Herbidospora solisilvae TaxID=2696284 RepID=A0A7C9J5F9_9ACTN|nr:MULTISPECIES: hypothetical protein [Herbidospora]NAS25227.1 hypothetical protein [Herbidospora solisilvae]